jgi:hypothetical protein
MKILRYNSEIEKQTLIDQEINNGLVLFEEQNHSDGEFLVFATTEEVADNEKKCANRELNERSMTGKNIGIMEDVIDLLVAKGVFAEDELPQETRRNLARTKELRSKAK